MKLEEAPPLPLPLGPEEMRKLSPSEKADRVGELMRAAATRYAAKLDLFLKENPHLDVRNPPTKS